MSLHHSSEIHNTMLQRIPEVTGRQLPAWFAALHEGPTLLRFEDRVSWLKVEHELPHSYATALVHEHDLRRSRR